MAKQQTRSRRKAKTAWELCERVCEQITAEPRTYDQRMWRLSANDWQIAKRPPRLRPKCGTAFCRAGWIVALRDGAKKVDNNSCQVRANAILNLPRDATDQLFSGVAERLERWTVRTPGSIGAAKAGVRGLRAFMKKHAAHLKARSLKGV